MQRVLIANRGEIAVRIIRACADLGLTSIAVHADPDAEALYVRLADEAWALPGTTGEATYLNQEAILDLARRSAADAVHPGYGFLSENATFARAVQEAGLIWVGPSPATIETLGDKVAARAVAERVGAPLIAGSPGPITSVSEVEQFAHTNGLPIVIKAAFGGGGRGMRVVRRMDDISEELRAAVREAEQAFGRGECFVERYLERPRHVEVQILADGFGTVLPIGTRDCSLQRRNQKLVEEAPAPFLTEELTQELMTSAAAICAAAGYVGAGTVEYLLADDGTLSFLGVNTRLQVEHPVTEETSGLDLVAWQLRIADGERLDPAVAQRPVRGHAIEFRINAEDPGRGYLPSPGRITTWRTPEGPGVRLDSGVTEGSSIPSQFDSMLAKLIIWGPARPAALARSRRALAEFVVEGVTTVLDFDRAVVDDPAFATDAFEVHTGWIENDFTTRLDPAPAPRPDDHPNLTRTWIEIDGRRVELGLPSTLTWGQAPSEEVEDVTVADGAVIADLPGVLGLWLVADGDDVVEGQPIAVVEAMKLETQVLAPATGILSHLSEAGSSIIAGQSIATIS